MYKAHKEVKEHPLILARKEATSLENLRTYRLCEIYAAKVIESILNTLSTGQADPPDIMNDPFDHLLKVCAQLPLSCPCLQRSPALPELKCGTEVAPLCLRTMTCERVDAFLRAFKLRPAYRFFSWVTQEWASPLCSCASQQMLSTRAAHRP